MSSGVEVRHYKSVATFQQDAGTMAAAGWQVVAQAETSGNIKVDWLMLAGLTAAVGIFVYWPLLIVAALIVVAGAATRPKQIVVTYRYAGA